MVISGFSLICSGFFFFFFFLLCYGRRFSFLIKSQWLEHHKVSFIRKKRRKFFLPFEFENLEIHNWAFSFSAPKKSWLIIFRLVTGEIKKFLPAIFFSQLSRLLTKVNVLKSFWREKFFSLFQSRHISLTNWPLQTRRKVKTTFYLRRVADRS